MAEKGHYLIGTEALTDLMSGNADFPVVQWMQEQNTDTSVLYLSAVSVGLVKRSIESSAAPAKRRHYQNQLKEILDTFPEERVLPAAVNHMDAWSDLLGHDQPLETFKGRKQAVNTRQLSDAELLVVAAALAKNLTLVEREQPYHAELSSFGLQTETLGE